MYSNEGASAQAGTLVILGEESRGQPASSNFKKNEEESNLESLPVELQLSILYKLSDVSSLSALVHASPLYHQAYVSVRQQVLLEVLFEEVGPFVLFDAWIVVQAQKLERENEDNGENVRWFLDQCKKSTLHNIPLKSMKELPLEELFSLARLQRTVQFVATAFVESAISNRPIACQLKDQHEPPSVTESQRMYRALYRLELFCRLFNEPTRKTPQPFKDINKPPLFVAFYPSREVEEIACIRDYIINFYHNSFKRNEEQLLKIYSDGSLPHATIYGCDPDSKKMPLPEHVLAITDQSLVLFLLEYEEHYLSCGLLFLSKVLQASASEKVHLLRQGMIDSSLFLTRAPEQNP